MTFLIPVMPSQTCLTSSRDHWNHHNFTHRFCYRASFGEKILGVTNETDSDGDPTIHKAAQAIWIYYVTFNTTIQNARIRWAQRGIQYDQNTGVTSTHSVSKCLFEEFPSGTSGIYINIPSGSGVDISDTHKYNVTTPVSVPAGSYSGSMSTQPYSTSKQFFGFRYGPEIVNLVPVGSQPDPMGAVGPSHYVELINQSIRIFSKTGAFIEEAGARTFFNTLTGDYVDPRIVFDPQTSRWIACMVDRTNKRLAIAISNDDSPAIGNWTTEFIDHDPNYSGDFPTLGFDRNGIYAVLKLFTGQPASPTTWKHLIVGIRKNAGSLVTPIDRKSFEQNSSYNKLIWQPVVNFDTTLGQSDYAWLLAKDVPSSNEGPIRYARLNWTQANNVWSLNFTDVSSTLDNNGTYYDLDQTATTASSAPQKPYQSNNNAIDLQAVGSRLNMAVARKISSTTYIWTCHEIGVNSSNGSTSPDRSASQWIKLQVSGSTLSIVDTGRIRDTASSNPYYFYRSSLMVDESGAMVIGYSASKSSEYIGALYYGGGWSNGLPTGRPVLIQPGQSYNHATSWGHYTYTTWDPSDASFWTVQQYSDYVPDGGSQPGNRWGSVIAKIKQN